ncbi:hypothetical protein A5780_19135 [Nocardia sp. 852002-20019_SCH5090214]|uniref:hypothetical protein n=1 Tax=Nocardia sp. 852002-20019_SCH5090214 TaxID=1834087 RepID=UPI0007EAB111|nr:hypothetical protein [Nocardia sp. 852002-20019_SCH5090214]OBA62175.1 hypothetical protein A5780_19135 [Nocardia sp. 852002-20019_SCH5090214]
MRARPTALGWIADEVSEAPEWDAAQLQRLARHLGYAMVWPAASLLALPDLVREADVDAVLTPSTEHIDALTLNAVMAVADVETVLPRLSFAKWPDFNLRKGLGCSIF